MQTSFSKEQFIYAGFFCRFAAFVTDSIVVALALLIVKVPIWILQGSLGDSFLFKPFLFEFTAVEVFYYLLTLAYFVLMTYYSGATVGKHLMKLKVVDSEGEKLTFMSVLIRESVGKYLSAFIVYIGYIMSAFDGRKQGLHDKIADTCVVYKHGLNHPRVQMPLPSVAPMQNGQAPFGQPVHPMQNGQVPFGQPVQPMQNGQVPFGQPVQPMQNGQVPFGQPVQPMQNTQPVQSGQLIQPGPNGRFSLPEPQVMNGRFSQPMPVEQPTQPGQPMPVEQSAQPAPMAQPIESQQPQQSASEVQPKQSWEE